LYNKWRAAAAEANQGEYSCCSFGGGVMREPNEQCHYYERDYHSWRGAGGDYILLRFVFFFFSFFHFSAAPGPFSSSSSSSSSGDAMISGMTSSALLCPNYRVRLLLKRERQLLFASASSSSSSSFFYVFFFGLTWCVRVLFFPSYFWCVRLVAS
jgi:hypothetical protein